MIPGAPAATGCIDRMAARLCEYDGKVSAVRFRGRTHLFTRSNLVPTGGGRHVQVASSVDGVTGWTCFEQLQIDGVRAFDAEFNLYFWTVRTVRLGDGSGGRALPAIFPAEEEEVGGVYAALSSDGVAWSRPVAPARGAGDERAHRPAGRRRAFASRAAAPSVSPSSTASTSASTSRRRWTPTAGYGRTRASTN